MSQESQTKKLLVRREGDQVIIGSPGVGVWRGGAREGEAIFAGGANAGTLSVLGVDYALVIPKGVAGRVVERFAAPAREPEVQFGDPLLVLAPLSAEGAAADAAAEEADAGGLAFRAPMSGRFYLRPSPDAEPFVKVGATLSLGETVCLLEVMKTFNRLPLRGDDLPPKVRVVAIGPEDGDDVNRGDILLRLEGA